MTSNDLQNLLNSTAVLGAFLLAGLFLRAKIPFFRRLLVPASVLGGVVGLLLGPQILGRSGIMLYDDEWVNIWSLLPSILMTPIFASLPLCNFKEKGEKKKLDKRHACTVFMEAGLGGACFAIQMLLGVGLALLISLADSSLYPYTNFGCEMPFGFNGGHALAGLLGGLLMENGRDYWMAAQSVASTYSTIGLLGGLIFGIFLINRAIRRGERMVVKQSAALDKVITYGFTTDISAQGSLGRETTHNSAINAVTVHVALLLIVSYLGCLLNTTFTALGLEYLSALPGYIWAMMIAYPVNWILNQLNLGWLFDSRIKGSVVAVCTDIAIVAAMASMDLMAVALYLLPIFLISAISFVVTYYMTIGIFRVFMSGNYPFERAIVFYGMNTGVSATGIALLRIIDPDFSSPAMEDFSLANAFMSIKDVVFVPVYLTLIAVGTPFQLMGWAVLEIAVMYAVAVAAKLIDNREKKQLSQAK